MIRTQDAVRKLAAGAVLEVTATDPGTLQDIPAWCRVHGHELLTTDTAENESGGGLIYRFCIRVGS